MRKNDVKLAISLQTEVFMHISEFSRNWRGIIVANRQTDKSKLVVVIAEYKETASLLISTELSSVSTIII